MKRDEMMLLVVVFLLGYFASRMFSTEGFSRGDCTLQNIPNTVNNMECNISEFFDFMNACGAAVTDNYQGQEDCDVRRAVNTAFQQSDCESFRVMGGLPVDEERCNLPPRAQPQYHRTYHHRHHSSNFRDPRRG